VIKNLGKFYRDVDGVSGATILGDGTVALILDVPKLVQLAVKDERDSQAACKHLQMNKTTSISTI
jgi:two-component system chemotaxis sensor kinase CheA